MGVLKWIVTVAVGLWILRILFHAGVRRALRVSDSSSHWRDRLLLRYQQFDFHPWLFAVLKTWLDPMFVELPQLLETSPPIQNFLDLGCGFGIAGSFLLDLLPNARACGIDPSAARVRGAAQAFRTQGDAFQAAAPDFEVPGLPGRFDAVFMLDMIHFLSDADLDLTLRRIRARLNDGHFLLIRATILPQGFGSPIWNLYALYRFVTGVKGYFRTIEQTAHLITLAGFDVVHSRISGSNPEMHWFVSTVSVAANQNQ